MSYTTRSQQEIICDEGGSLMDPLLPSSEGTNRSEEPLINAKLLLKIYAIVFCINLGTQILGPAQIQIFESIHCSQWYERHPTAGLPTDGSIPESYCKLAPIQTQVSTLKGWLEFFSAAPGLILSIPAGILTDKIGRRALIIANLTVLFLTQAWTTFVTWFGGQIPLRAVWLGASLNMLSGGTIVTELLYACVLTDITPSNQVAETFFRTSAFGQFSKVVGPFIAAALMRIDPWLAVYLGLLFLITTVVLASTVPETLHSSISSPGGSIEVHGDQQAAEASWERPKTRFLALHRLQEIWSDWRLVFVALTYPFMLVCYALGDLLQRYVSDGYGWTLANATLIYSLQAIAAGLVLFILLPFTSGHIGRRFNFSVIQTSVVLSRAALLFMSVAYAVIGLAPNVGLMIIGLLIETLSTGLPSTLRAIATALIDDSDRGRVFSVLAISETLSTMMAYPLTAALFNIGIEKGGGSWLGLPYDLLSVAAALGFTIMCLVRFERPLRF